MQGYFHGTGHGVGLDIHEMPRISRTGSLLQEGHVVTVEPGLYYPGLGAVRIEDMVLVTKDGCRNLTNFPKTSSWTSDVNVSEGRSHRLRYVSSRLPCASPSRFNDSIPKSIPRPILKRSGSTSDAG